MRTLLKGISLGVVCLTAAGFALPTNVAPAEAPQTLQDMVRQTAVKYGVPPLLSEALIDVESNWNPEAMGINVGSDGRVKSRDHGLMQINDANAKRYGVSWVELYNNPKVNIELGHTILANCQEKFRNERSKEVRFRKTIACYNAGPGNLGAGYAHADKVLNKLKQRLFNGL